MLGSSGADLQVVSSIQTVLILGLYFYPLEGFSYVSLLLEHVGHYLYLTGYLSPSALASVIPEATPVVMSSSVWVVLPYFLYTGNFFMDVFVDFIVLDSK